MLLSWKVGKIIEGQNITFKIKYLSEFGQAQVSIQKNHLFDFKFLFLQNITIRSDSINKNEFQLTNLRPFTSYNISIKLKVKGDRSSLWSEYKMIETERTKQAGIYP